MTEKKRPQERKSSPRLTGYAYDLPGYYFITICTAERALRFGEVSKGRMTLNSAGRIVQESWQDIPNHHAHVELDEFILMPNHLHGILIINSDGGRDRFINLSLQNRSEKESGDGNQGLANLSEIIRGFKTWSARRVNKLERKTGTPMWQRSFYDHIVRDRSALDAIRLYIRENAAKWELDQENPQNLS